jgi:hypothetical protein
MLHSLAFLQLDFLSDHMACTLLNMEIHCCRSAVAGVVQDDFCCGSEQCAVVKLKGLHGGDRSATWVLSRVGGANVRISHALLPYTLGSLILYSRRELGCGLSFRSPSLTHQRTPVVGDKPNGTE